MSWGGPVAFFPSAVPCPTEGCQNTMLPTQKVCGACAIRIHNEMEREKARWDLYANNGIHQLEEYLGKWAAFAVWEISRFHPPV